MSDKDHVDRFLERFGERLPPMDLVVEGIVDRIGGLNRRLNREMDETLAEFGLNRGEWKVLGTLWRAGEPHRISPGELARVEELSTGAMTNTLVPSGRCRIFSTISSAVWVPMGISQSGQYGWPRRAYRTRR